MKIERMEIRIFSNPLIEPFEANTGVTSEGNVVLVRAFSEGLSGWGECATDVNPYYSYETLETAWHILRDFIAPRIINQDIEDAAELAARLAPIRGHNMAKAGIDMAFWDLTAQREEKALAEVLGGVREKVPIAADVGVKSSIKSLLEEIETFIEQGYSCIKMKLIRGFDIEPVKEARRAFPDIGLAPDGNGAFTLGGMELLKKLDQHDLMMLEQPLGVENLLDHAKLQKVLSTPISLDESIHSFENARTALHLGCGKIVNVKLSRVGGHYEGKRIEELCRAKKMAARVGARVVSSGIGTAHDIAHGSLAGYTMVSDVPLTGRYYAVDLTEPPVEMGPGATVAVPKEPGLGFRVREGVLQRYTLRKEVLR